MRIKPFLTSEEIAARVVEELASDKPRKLTPEQIEAIYSNGTNILVSASAGSGKTFIMVRRILDMISRGVTVDRLFISTFTVKAAGELKERLQAGLLELLQETRDEETKAYLSEQLALLPTADIGTMDAFTQKLVSQYGYLLGISPVFRIMADASEQALLRQDVYVDLFSDYMTGKDAQTFKRLVKNFSGNSKSSNKFRDLVYQIYYFSQATASPKSWLADQFLVANETPIEDQLASYLADFLSPSVLDQAISEAIAFFQHHYETVTKEFQKSYKYLTAVEDLLALLTDFDVLASQDYVAEQLEKIVALSSQITMRVGNVKDEELKLFAKGYNQERPTYLSPFLEAKRALMEAAFLRKYQPETLPLLELLKDFVADFSGQYLQAKIQENAFEFHDIAHFAIEILEEFPEVARSYQDRFHEVMVDEYQDNSHIQERMLELLSNGKNRFMVGDIKQSIYRFRQADPQIFNQKFKLFQENPDAGKLILLKENFRSSSEVLDATNDLFSHLMDEKVGDIRYDDRHVLIAGSDGQKEKKLENKTQLLVYNTDSSDSQETEATDESTVSQGEIAIVLKEIIRLHNDEKVPFKDMTLLVRSRTGNDLLLSLFEKHGIPLVADGGQSNYLQSLEVMIMLDTLRAINNPLDDYALVALLRSPMFQFDEDDLARIAVQAKHGDFYDKLELAQERRGAHADLVTDDLKKKLDIFMETFLSWRSLAKRLALYDLIWTIYNDRFYYDYVGALPRAEQRQANLYALALRAHAYEKSGFKGLSRFITLIDRILASEHDLADVEVTPPKNAVQLMTIHKSKGLEFKYVFILGADKSFFNAQTSDQYQDVILSRDQGIGIRYLADMTADFSDTRLPKLQVKLDTIPFQRNQKETKISALSELMRLLYVGMTRAEKRLYLIGKGSQEKLSSKYNGDSKNGFLPSWQREEMTTFQDWFLSVEAAFKTEQLAFDVVYIDQAELVSDKIGRLEITEEIHPDDLSQNRQSAEIERALTILKSVDDINTKYRSAINLPTLRTPSEIKQFYEPIMDTDGLEVMGKAVAESKQEKLIFALPNFETGISQTATAVGSATHELMQRLDMTKPITESAIKQALQTVQGDKTVKAQVKTDKILAFFETDLGKEIMTNTDKLYREAPFAMLTKDKSSGEEFVVRGIVDGYLLYEDHIVLFDYKTDKFTNSHGIIQRYQNQMALYAQALSQSYGIAKVDKYLVLLGGETFEIVRID
ncbi:helicase-exonuclease AddAB subunit AddA [Streptococcus sp. S784/96/1]|uniref:helicase-exonuclease AddAB subunit AddA n=1 Tax=Streptococcus sp. S784/96/1 TaxID=2653499 RepID=UPI0013894D8B|nr:helicase-exonuclease AddAB subunit AddA [Streptococcus sp. S784/96/1]